MNIDREFARFNRGVKKARAVYLSHPLTRDRGQRVECLRGCGRFTRASTEVCMPCRVADRTKED